MAIECGDCIGELMSELGEAYIAFLGWVNLIESGEGAEVTLYRDCLMVEFQCGCTWVLPNAETVANGEPALGWFLSKKCR